MAGKAPPIIDFGPYYGTNPSAKADVTAQIHQACQEHGFFQITNHGVPSELQHEVLAQAQDFFNLPLETKELYDKDIGGFNRGYERLRSQNFEKRPQGDLKEGFYFGTDLPLSHPFVQRKRINMGPNKYPSDVRDPAVFKQTVDAYFAALYRLASDLFQIVMTNLGAGQAEWLDEFCDTPIAILRLLHYPPQQVDASGLERGIGAHTDFGAITILLQDLVGGLQVWSRDTAQWIDVVPVQGAFVVNLGNLMMRWTNDRYLSNLHRVINKSGKERYSIPFFFSGNPGFVVRCLDSCEHEVMGAKYPPISVNDWMSGRYADTYGKDEGKKGAMADLAVDVVKAAS